MKSTVNTQSSKILVVDDEKSIRVTTSEFLKDEGYEVDVAEDAAVAKDMLIQKEFDVVLVDIIIPRVTGVDLLKSIKEASPQVQVIMMTGEPTVETASEAVRAGAFDYLTKPIEINQFLKVVGNAVKIKAIDNERRRLAEENLQYQENLEQLVDERTKELKNEIDVRRQTEKELKKLSAATEQSPTSIIITNPDGNIEYANPKFCKLTGYSFQEVIGKNPRFLQSGEMKKKEYIKLWKTILSGKTWRGEFHNKKKNGELFWENAAISPILNEQREISNFIAVKEDITLRKQSEAALKKESTFLESLTTSTPGAIAVLDPQSRVIKSNQNFYNLFGYAEEETIGKNINDLIVPENFVKEAKSLCEYSYLKSFKGIQTETVRKHKNGSLINVSIMGSDITIDGEFVGIYAIYLDISKRTQAEEKFRDGEKRFRSLVESATDAIIICDHAGKITVWNNGAQKIFGYSADEIIGKPATELMPEFYRPQHANGMHQFLKSGKEKHAGETLNVEGLKKNGDVFPLELTLSNWKTHGKIFMAAIIRDISQRMKVNEEKNILEEQLRRSQKLETIGTMAGGIAHDFNNILTPILGYTDMAVIELADSEQELKHNLSRVLEGAHRAKDLIEQILLFSKQIEKERNPFSMQLIVNEAIQLLRSTIPSTVQIIHNIDSDCGKILADATQIHQVIVNLCTNAWHAMEKNGGTLTIKLKQVEVNSSLTKQHPNLTEAGYVCLTIKDTGHGMDTATASRIFEPFFTTKAVDKGTGLGLSVVHGIIQNHQGDIVVESKLGAGTQFHVYLPVIKDGAETKEEKVLDALAGNESILVVDDDKVIGTMLKKMLERLGYSVDLYSQSKEALAVFEKQPDKYDLIISDLTMPDFTGLNLSKRVQKTVPGFPIIIITGYGNKLFGVKQEDYGIKKIIQKPIVMNELAFVIREVLDN